MVENPFTWSLPTKILPLLQSISLFITIDTVGRKEKHLLKSSAVVVDIGLELGVEHSTSQKVQT